MASELRARPARKRWRGAALLVALLASAALVGAQDGVPSGGDDVAGGAVRILNESAFVKTVRGDENGDAPGERVAPWQARALPDLWRMHAKGDSGYGWYRLTFELAEVPSIPWAMYVDFA
ncbi:MAG TPA: hypothetical protein VII31_14675, partial [Caldimonas sp.]